MDNFDPNEALHKILHETEGNCKMAMQLCQQLMEKNNELEDKMEDLTIQFELMLQKSKEKVQFLKKKLEINREDKEQLKFKVMELDMKIKLDQCEQEFDFLSNQDHKVLDYKKKYETWSKGTNF